MIAAVACAGVLFAAGTARAEIVAKNATDGLLALSPAGVPSVAYVRGTRMVVATRAGKAKWRSVTAARTTPGATVKAFKIGAAGPVALVQSSDDHALMLVHFQRQRCGSKEVLTWSKTSRGEARSVGCPLGLEQRMVLGSDGGSD